MSKERTIDSNSLAFSLVAGRHHGPDCWEYVQTELEEAGYNCIVHDLPIENSLFSVDDHARLISKGERESGADEIWRVGWSWGANVIPRLTDRTPVKGLIYLAGAFKPETVRSKLKGVIPKPLHSIAYDAMEKKPTRQAFEEMAAYVFYHDVEDKRLVASAISKLRRHDRRDFEPQLAPYPSDITSGYVVLTDDKALLPDYQYKIAELLHIPTHPLESGHAPMYSLEKSRKLAGMLIEMANKNGTS